MNTLAAYVGAFGSRWPGSGFGMGPAAASAGVPPVSFPVSKLTARVELYLGGAWVDVSAYVLYDARIRISRGRRPNQRRTSPATCALTFKNPDKRFSPRNVTGPWFGLLQRRNPIRVTVNAGSGDSVRFTGKVPSWEPRLKGHPNDREVPIVAVGARDRVEQSDDPLASAQLRFLGADNQANTRLLYRSLEDGDFPGRTAGPPGSAPLPDLARGGVASDNVPSGWVAGGGTSWAVDIDVKFPLGEAVPGSNAIATRWDTQGTLSGWRLFDDGTGVGLIYYTAADGAPHVIRTSINAYDGVWHHYRVTCTQNGTGIDVVLYMDGTSVLTSTITTSTLGRCFYWQIADEDPAAGAARMPAVGHVFFYLLAPPAVSNFLAYQAFTGWAGETAAQRFQRLCTEEGLTCTVGEGTADVILMGPQRPATLPRLFDEIEDACEGLIDETRDDVLRLSTLRSRYNREVALTVDYAAGDVLPPLSPADDAEWLVNRWTLTRPDGGTAVAERVSGPLNSSEPEDGTGGVGLWKKGDDINVGTDDDLYVSAGWRVWRDTVDEPRYPLISLQLAASPDLIPEWLTCDIGSRMIMANGPDDVGPNDPDLIIEGYDETIDQLAWDVDLYAEPASTYQLGTLVTTAAGASPYTPRLDCGGSTLRTAVDDTTTSLTLDVVDNCVWTSAFGPYPVCIGGEDMMVTAAAAATGTYPARQQVLTVTRGLNTAAMAHAAGTAVHVCYPIILAR